MSTNNSPMQNCIEPMFANNSPMQNARSQCPQTTILCKLHEANVSEQQSYANCTKPMSANNSPMQNDMKLMSANNSPMQNRKNPMFANKYHFPTCGRQDFPCTG